MEENKLSSRCLRGVPGVCKAYFEMMRGRIKLAKREMSRTDLFETTVGKQRWKGIPRGSEHGPVLRGRIRAGNRVKT